MPSPEPKTPQKGANRDVSTGQSHGAEGSESPNGRGSNAAPALGAAPAFHTPEPGPQQVLKAEAARPDATDRGAPDIASPGGGPTGAGQPAAAGPTGDQRRGPATGAQADGCRAPECHAGACSGRAQQDQTSLPASPMRIALWSDGALQVQTPRGDDLVVFSRDEVRQLVEYLSDPAMALREQGASA